MCMAAKEWKLLQVVNFPEQTTWLKVNFIFKFIVMDFLIKHSGINVFTKMQNEVPV